MGGRGRFLSEPVTGAENFLLETSQDNPQERTESKMLAGTARALLIASCANAMLMPIAAVAWPWDSPDPEQGMEFRVTHDAAVCTDDYPLLVEIINGSSEDVTDVQFLAYAHDQQYSRAECAEFYDLQDLVIGAGKSYKACWSTLGSKGIVYQGEKASAEMIDDAINLLYGSFMYKYGSDAMAVQNQVLDRELKLMDVARDLNPRQGAGCREVPSNVHWFGRLVSLKIFSGF